MDSTNVLNFVQNAPEHNVRIFMKKFLTSILFLLTMLMVNFSVLNAAPTPQLRTISLLTKCSTITALCGSVALYAAFSNVYKQECLAKDEVMESADFKEFSLKIIHGILSTDTEVRTKYSDKYPKIATTLQVTVGASGLMALLGFNDLVNYLVLKPKPEMCTMETQVSKQMIIAETKKLQVDGAVEALEEEEGNEAN